MAKPTENITSLYLHIPFCERKCEYCDFVSVAGTKLEEPYIEALITELNLYKEKLGSQTFDTVFFGGGTPGLLDPARIGQVLDVVRLNFEISENAEVTIEANPSSITCEKAQSWRAAGVNRVSIGVQSLNDSLLKFLGRVHDSSRAIDAVGEVMAAGISNVNCDLIYGIPELSDDVWLDSLARIAELKPQHVACYELTVESGTPLAKSVELGRVTMPEEESALRQHWIAVDMLSGLGYQQYEISNFAKPNFACKHNLTYWQGGHYLAAGVGAHGHLPARFGVHVSGVVSDQPLRYWNVKGIARYIERITAGKLGVDGWETVDEAAQRSEEIMLRLRLGDGLRVAPEIENRVQELVEAGLLSRSKDLVRPTRRGQEVLNAITSDLVNIAVP